jgi:hypothetical protein
MAITPRTILSRPINLLAFALGVLTVGGLMGLFVGAQKLVPCQSSTKASPAGPQMDAGVSAADEDTPSPDVTTAAVGTSAAMLDHTCQLERPASDWNEAEWLRHLDCMEARGESTHALLEETEQAIEALGLTPELALEKSDHLDIVGTADEHLAFLEAAVDELGVVDGHLVHRLSRALLWRADGEDLERIRHLQMLSRALMPDSCEVLQTDIWARYAMLDDADQAWPAAHRAVRDAIGTYVAHDCQQRRHSGEWNVLAEIVGVGVIAETTNGHAGHSTLIRQVSEAYHIRQVPTLCKRGVPDYGGLRDYCVERVRDEQFLSRR